MSCQQKPFELPDGIPSAGHWLLTSASAKVDLAVRMHRAIHAAGRCLFTTDCDSNAPALHVADGGFVLPPVSSPTYLDALLDACMRREIRVILPTRDADVRYFAQHFDRLVNAGIWPLVSASESVMICQDKIRFYDHCVSNRIPVLPRMQTELTFPCYVRPRVGAASVGSQVVPSIETMSALFGNPPWDDLLIQPVCHAPEYTIDALFDWCGKPVQWIARERCKVRAGESVVSRTVQIPALDAIVPVIAESLHLFGPVTLQAFYSPEAGVYMIEVNPRFGGASALGIEAGLQTPERLVAWVNGDVECFRKSRPLHIGLTMLRYSKDLFIAKEDLLCRSI